MFLELEIVSRLVTTSATHRRDIIEYLPTELALKIFSYLRFPDILECRKVSRAWQAASHGCDHIWRSLRLQWVLYPDAQPYDAILSKVSSKAVLEAELFFATCVGLERAWSISAPVSPQRMIISEKLDYPRIDRVVGEVACVAGFTSGNVSDRI